MTMMPINTIIVGQQRHRSDLGDVRSLAQSIEELGMLHAVVIDQHHNLLAGRRRLEAARLLGWRHVPVHVVEVGPCA